MTEPKTTAAAQTTTGDFIDRSQARSDEMIELMVLGRSGDEIRRRKEGVERAASRASGQITDWEGVADQIVAPPHNPDGFARLPQFSAILPQAIAARAEGIEAHGFELVEKKWSRNDDEVDDAFLKAAEDERERILEWWECATTEYSTTELRKRTRIDRDHIGWSVWELIPDDEGNLVGLLHGKGRTFRLGRLSKEEVPVERFRFDKARREWVSFRVLKHVRLYAQVKGGQTIWFREPGDDRAIHKRTGLSLDGKDKQIRPIEPKDYRNPNLAHELIWWQDYNPAGPYGLPFWVGTAPVIAGARSAEEVNLGYFENNTVPPLAILVSGGRLMGDAERLEEQLEELRGVENWHKVLILQAVGKTSATAADLLDPSRIATPKIELMPLFDQQLKDALFLGFDEQARLKVRSSAGISPLHIGLAEDHTRATAEASLWATELMTFAPPRRPLSEEVNRVLAPRLGWVYWRWQASAPKISNSEQIGELIKTAREAGVGTPNEWAGLISQLAGRPFAEVDSPWANLPFAITQAAITAGVLTLVEGAEEGTFELVVAENAESNTSKMRTLVAEMIEDTVDRVLRTAAVVGERAAGLEV